MVDCCCNIQENHALQWKIINQIKPLIPREWYNAHYNTNRLEHEQDNAGDKQGQDAQFEKQIFFGKKEAAGEDGPAGG